jgi:hypothetical protein
MQAAPAKPLSKRSKMLKWALWGLGIACVARAVTLAKIANCRTVVLRALREKAEGDGTEELGQAARRLGRLLETVSATTGLEEIRGHEGDHPDVGWREHAVRILLPRTSSAHAPAHRAGSPTKTNRQGLSIQCSYPSDAGHL